jgi:hypothetical protein
MIDRCDCQSSFTKSGLTITLKKTASVFVPGSQYAASRYVYTMRSQNDVRLVVNRSLNPCISAFSTLDLGLPSGRRDATPNLSSCGLHFTVHTTTTFLYSIRLTHRPGLARSTICISICRTPSISNFGSFSQPNVISYNQLNPLRGS